MGAIGGAVVVEGGGFCGATSAFDWIVGSGVNGLAVDSSKSAQPERADEAKASAKVADAMRRVLRDVLRPPVVMVKTLRNRCRAPPRRSRFPDVVVQPL